MADELTVSRENLSGLLMNGIGLGVVAVNAVHEVVEWNRWLELQTRIPAADVLGKQIGDVFPDLERRGMLNKFDQVLAEGTARFLSPFFHKYFIPIALDDSEDTDTSFMVQHIKFLPIVREKSITGVLILVEDVTERVSFEAALKEAQRRSDEASAAKSEFLANMSHEIRTPMNGILGMTEFALDTDLTDSQAECLNMVKTSADSLLQIINDVLDFSKIEAGGLTLESTTFSLRDSFNKIITTMGWGAREKGLEINLDLDPDIPDLVIGNPVRLQQVVVNLVGNAVKFTEQGRISIVIGSGCLTDESVELSVAVRDTGIGITEENQERIFSAFSQASESTTRLYGGTGLGLSISSDLVELMGGRLSVSSEVGKGSVFSFTIGLGVSEQQCASQPSVMSRK
jgi:signal transduction histidine kinase